MIQGAGICGVKVLLKYVTISRTDCSVIGESCFALFPYLFIPTTEISYFFIHELYK